MTNKNNNWRHNTDRLCHVVLRIHEQTTFYVCCAEIMNWTVWLGLQWRYVAERAAVSLPEMSHTVPVILLTSRVTLSDRDAITDIHNLHCPPNIVRVMKSRRMSGRSIGLCWGGDVVERYVPGSSRSSLISVTAYSEDDNESYNFL
jgi:hypothetical protein